tara:strand:- start:3557 stop:4780 length:1224 start_codon:yes stop_codon:yes gene_type:complete
MINFEKVVELTKRIGYARALPGALNFLGLFLAIKLLGEENYGVFSIAFGIVSIAIQVLFGLLIHGIVPLLSSDASQVSIRSISLKYAVITAIALSIGAILLFWLNSFYAISILLVAFYGLDLVLLELLRMDSKFKIYGIVALVRAISILIAIAFLWMFNTLTPFSFMVVYCLGSVMLIFTVFVKTNFYDSLFDKERIGSDLIKSMFDKGSKGTVVNLVDNSIPTILKIVIQASLGDIATSQFSSSVDLAKRIVGIVFNLTTFIGLPSVFTSFRLGLYDEARRYQTFLFAYSSAAIFILACIYSLAYASGLPVSGFIFQNNIFIFSLVSGSVLIQRSRKLIIDPMMIFSTPLKSIVIVGILVTVTTLLISQLAALRSVEMFSLQLVLASVILFGAYWVVTKYARARMV